MWKVCVERASESTQCMHIMLPTIQTSLFLRRRKLLTLTESKYINTQQKMSVHASTKHHNSHALTGRLTSLHGSHVGCPNGNAVEEGYESRNASHVDCEEKTCEEATCKHKCDDEQCSTYVTAFGLRPLCVSANALCITYLRNQDFRFCICCHFAVWTSNRCVDIFSA